jgi:hypothetical protein
MSYFTTQKPPRRLGFSHLFSYWLFAWGAAYYLYFAVLQNSSIVATRHLFANTSEYRGALNPTPALAVALAENVAVAGMLLVRRSARAAAIFLAGALCTKGVLLFLLRHEPLALGASLLHSLALFCAYTVYLAYLGTTAAAVYRRVSASLVAGDGATPMYALAARLR